MAVGWWAETFSSSQSEFKKLKTDVLGAQSQFGLSSTEFKKLSTQAQGLMWDALAESNTQFKKLSTQASGLQTSYGTAASMMKKLSTQAVAGVTFPVEFQTIGTVATGVGIPNPGSFAAPLNSDVFVAASMDRTGTFTGALYGGDAGIEVGVVAHNNDTTKGITKLYRFPKKGTGVAKSFSVQGTGGGWFAAVPFAFSGITSVGAPQVVWGSSINPSQTVTEEGVQILGRGAGGSGVGTPTAFSGVVNRGNFNANGTTLAVNEVEGAATTGATTQNYPWGYIFLPLRNY